MTSSLILTQFYILPFINSSSPSAIIIIIIIISTIIITTIIIIIIITITIIIITTIIIIIIITIIITTIIIIIIIIIRLFDVMATNRTMLLINRPDDQRVLRGLIEEGDDASLPSSMLCFALCYAMLCLGSECVDDISRGDYDHHYRHHYHHHHYHYRHHHH